MRRLVVLLLVSCSFLFTANAQIIKRDPQGGGGFPSTNPTNPDYNPFADGTDTLDNEVVDTSKQIIYQNTDTINFVKIVREYNLNLQRKAPVFSVDNVHQYQPVMNPNDLTVNLGNNGLPVLSLTYSADYRSAIDFGMNSYNAYRIQDDSVKYYQAQRPFTKLFYVTGSRRENKFKISHTQNWGKGLNVGAHYESLVSNGFYSNQKIDHKNFVGHAWFQSKNKKLNFMAHYLSNKHLVGANGGIQVFSNVYENSDYNQRTAIDVAMPNAESFYKGNSFQLQSSYDLGQSFKAKINDSISDLQLVPRFRLQHKIQLQKGFDHFKSSRLESSFFENTYRADTLKTLDTLNVKRLSNEFRIKWLGNKLVDSTIVRQNFLADAYTRFDTYTVDMLNNRTDKLTDLVIGGNFRSNPLDSAKVLYKAAGEYHVIDYRQGDYRVRGEAGFNLNDLAGKLVGFIELNNQEQPYTANRFEQTHYQFNNQLKKLNARTLGAQYYNPKLQTMLGAEFINASNVLRYGENRQPFTEDNLTYVLVKAGKHFQYKKFGSDVLAVYQTSSNDVITRKPTAIARGNVYYKGPLFKNNVYAKMGLNASYTTKQQFDGYDPALQQFFVQEDFDYKNNAQIGFFTNFSLSRARVFLRLDHLNSFVYKQPIMLAHNYPQHDFAFRAGINWVFVN